MSDSAIKLWHELSPEEKQLHYKKQVFDIFDEEYASWCPIAEKAIDEYTGDAYR
jgi:hypothetical protein